jgi:UMP-CMP kinase
METLIKRFETFNEQSMPVIKTYEKMQKVKKIDASKDKDSVYNDVKKTF